MRFRASLAETQQGIGARGGANAHRPFPVGSAAGNAPAEARASPRTSGPASARPVDADAALKPKPKRKGKRERAQERARREAEAANA